MKHIPIYITALGILSCVVLANQNESLIVKNSHVLTAEEQAKLTGAVHPLVRTNPRTGRRSLYLASHAASIVDWPLPEARLLLHDLTEHATRTRFLYRHAWRPDDLVIWDNLSTMHRARPFADTKHRRERGGRGLAFAQLGGERYVRTPGRRTAACAPDPRDGTEFVLALRTVRGQSGRREDRGGVASRRSRGDARSSPAGLGR